MKLKNFPKYIWDSFAIRKQKLQELSIKTFLTNSNVKIFTKAKKLYFLSLFEKVWMGFDYYKFQTTCKMSEKSNTYISNEAVHSQTHNRT